MAIYTMQLKTHSREDITDQFSDLNDCVTHNCRPQILKIVAGRSKETHYVATCGNDECGKISFEAEKVVAAWNKWNPKQPENIEQVGKYNKLHSK